MVSADWAQIPPVVGRCGGKGHPAASISATIAASISASITTIITSITTTFASITTTK